MKFVMIFSKDCGHCVKFKKDYLDRLYSKIKDLNVDIIQIDLTSRDKYPSSSGKYKLPSSLWKYVKYFPTFMLIPDDTFNDPDKKPENILIFGSIVSKSGKVNSIGSDRFDDSSIASWVETNLRLKDKQNSLPKKILTEKR